MRGIRATVLFIALWASACILPSFATAMDINQFYRRLVQELKASRYAKVEKLVRQNRNEAQQALSVIRKKIEQERETRKKDSLNLIATELEEVIAVTGGGKDCEMSQRITNRGQATALPEEGLEAFRRALKLCPDNMEAMLALAKLHKQRGKFDEAMSGYQGVLSLKRDDQDALMGMGELLYTAGLYERAVPYFEQVMRYEPESKYVKRLRESCLKQIALDRDGVIPSNEIEDRLQVSLEGNLMCMCPSHGKLITRIRFRSVTFDSDSAMLNSTAKEQLSELAMALKTAMLAKGRYLIEGHADPIGPKDYNSTLSAKRAEAVKRYLVDSLKVNPNILAVDGVGSSRSWTTNETSAGLKANRRIELVSLGSSEERVLAPTPEPGNKQR